MALLSGCNVSFRLFRTTDELYSLPRASEEYTSLQAAIQELMDAGLEYAAPLSGTNTQPVRLFDLDGDGENEALAFCRDRSAESSQLKIYIFKKNSSDIYTTACTIEGDGTDINSVVMCQLMGDESSPYELVVTWQVSSTVYMLSAYSLEDYQPTDLMTPTSYTRYSAQDLDGDGESELVVLTIDNSDSTLNNAVLYDNSENRMSAASTASLSNSLSSIDKIRDGVLADGTPVLYVTGTVLEESGSSSTQITDILMMQDGLLCNITLDGTTMNSASTLRTYLTGGQDINGDGVLELPFPFSIPAKDPGSSDTFYGVDWKQYAADGTSSTVFITYYNSADGWYLELPESWLEELSLARQDTSVSSTNERGVLFYWNGQEEPFLGIYKNTGANRERRSTEDGKVIFYRDSDAIYSVRFFPDDGMSVEDLISLFHLITTDWSSE